MSDKPPAAIADDLIADAKMVNAGRQKRWLRRTVISLIAIIAIWSAVWFGYGKFLEQQAIQIIAGGNQAAAEANGTAGQTAER
ncbi:MAG: hypothetical protein AAF556_09570, partial [Pseudomonadota bacterium]